MKILFSISIFMLCIVACSQQTDTLTTVESNHPSAPTLSSPSNGSTNQPTSLSLSWNKGSGASSYILQVSTSNSFGSYVYNQSGLTNTTQQVTGLSSNTKYYWRVSAANSYGTSSWSSVWAFTTTGTAPVSPTLISPLNISVNQSITSTLIWNAVSGATSYTLQVSTSSSFTNNVYNQSGLTVTSQQISTLCYLTQYYWRVNANNSYGTSGWSSVWTFTTSGPCTGIIIVNYGGKTYNTVEIGKQCWLKENLDVGTLIQGDQDQKNNGTIEKYCYNNDVNNCAKYGGLYQWAEAVQYRNGATNRTSPYPSFSGNVQGICPPGWHIPTFSEFVILKIEVNNSGNTLKAIGQGSGIGTGTNSSGFSALLAGYRNHNGRFYNLGFEIDFWSSTEDSDNDYANQIMLSKDTDIIADFYDTKNMGFSVRCAKD